MNLTTGNLARQRIETFEIWCYSESGWVDKSQNEEGFRLEGEK